MIKFVPFENGNVFGMKAFDGETEAGLCTFTLDGYFMNFETVECAAENLIIHIRTPRNQFFFTLPHKPCVFNPFFQKNALRSDGIKCIL